MAIARNFFFNHVFTSPEHLRDEHYKYAKMITKDENAMKSHIEKMAGKTQPFNHQRYAHVQENARKVSSNPQLLQELVQKTRFCTNAKCNPEKCGFAHTMEEYNTPTCLHQEFCLNSLCVKNHGFTKEEYVDYYDLKVPEKKKNLLEQTQFCCLMKENKPCHFKFCTFAHSIWEYRTMNCRYDKDCTDKGCVRYHSNETLFEYIQKQGVKLQPWMFRSIDINNHMEMTNRNVQQNIKDQEWIEKYTIQIKKLEENGWKDEDIDLSTPTLDLSTLSLDEKDEKDDDDLIITFNGKSSISLSSIEMEEAGELDDYDYDDDNDDDDNDYEEDSLNLDEEEDVMKIACDLGLSFDEVYNMIINDKKDVLFKWYENYLGNNM